MIIYFKKIAANFRPLTASPVIPSMGCGTTKLDIMDINGPDGQRIFNAINNAPPSPKNGEDQERP